MLQWTLGLLLLLCLAKGSEVGTSRQESAKRRRSLESEADRQMVTIDLSALRPSLPGLVLYNYGDQAPKLVQIDLSSLNPQLQPHVIWPQFDQLELEDDRPYELENVDGIPYLSETTPLLSPRPQRLSGLGEWPEMSDIADGDIYDFLPGSLRNEELMTLHRSLPLADEVIVPLDWEEDKPNRHPATSKRNVFVSKGWKPGGQKQRQTGRAAGDKTLQFEKAGSSPSNDMYTPFGPVSWRPGKRQPFHPRREIESEDVLNESQNRNVIKKDVFVSKGWGPGGRALSTASLRGAGRGNKARGRHGRNVDGQPARISSQESWATPRQYWKVPHLFGAHFQ